MPSFIRPAGNVPVSSSWQAHKNRTPPSQEPGTDYACATGTAFVAPEAGIIRGLRTTPATAAGRYILIQFDTGDWGRGLHLRTVDVKVGQKVTRGQKLGTTGGSANNSETGVPPHIHWSWWPGRGNNAPAIASTPTADFEAYLSKQAAPAPAKPSTSTVLKKGSKDARVGKLQAGLNRVFPSYKNAVKVGKGKLLKVDNDFGAATDAWVKEFQRRTGLKVDGIVGAATIAKLASFGIIL